MGATLKRLGGSAAFAVALLVAFAARAQTADTNISPSAERAGAQPAPTAACELHVWPGSDLVYLYFGWAHGGTIDGAVKGREGYPKAPQNPLTSQVQGELIAQQQPQLLLDRPDYRVVMHPEVLPSRVIRTSFGRIAPSQSLCYAELIVDDIILSQNVIGGNALRAIFRFRDFGPNPEPMRTFGTWTITPLTQFPPKNPDDSAAMAAGTAELKAAFISDLKQFVTALRKPPKKH